MHATRGHDRARSARTRRAGSVGTGTTGHRGGGGMFQRVRPRGAGPAAAVTQVPGGAPGPSCSHARVQGAAQVRPVGRGGLGSSGVWQEKRRRVWLASTAVGAVRTARDGTKQSNAVCGRHRESRGLGLRGGGGAPWDTETCFEGGRLSRGGRAHESRYPLPSGTGREGVGRRSGNGVPRERAKPKAERGGGAGGLGPRHAHAAQASGSSGPQHGDRATSRVPRPRTLVTERPAFKFTTNSECFFLFFVFFKF